MNKRGTILDLKKTSAIVMTEDCRFVYLKRSKEMFVGQQIEVSKQNIIKSRSNKLKYTKLVACFLMIILVFITPFSFFKFYSSEKVYAYVDIDINPSLEVSISKDNKVLSVKAINDDGEELLKNVKIEGKNLECAVNEIIDQSRDNGYIKPETDNYVLISASLASKATKDEKDLSEEEEKLSGLIGSLEGTTQEKDKEMIEVKVVNTDPEIKKQASENGISMGKYELYLEAKGKGLDLSIEDIRSSSVYDIFKKLNMDLIDSRNNESQATTQTNSVQGDKGVTSSSISNPQGSSSSDSAKDNKNNNDYVNKSQVNYSSDSAKTNESSIRTWAIGVKYDVGAVVSYSNNIYKCIQAHTSQADWIPSSVPALWQKQVDMNSNNTWQTAVNYSAGTLVIYNGVKYKCIQGHLSMQGREPNNVPALWQKQ